MQLLGIDRMLGAGNRVESVWPAADGGDFRLSAALHLAVYIQVDAKMATGAQVIEVRPTDRALAVDTSSARPGRPHRHAGSGGLRCPEINAFATGWNRNDSLVAVSTACSTT